MIVNNFINIFNHYNYKLDQGHKLSIYKLSKLTGVPRTTLTRLMNGKSREVNYSTLNALVQFFNVPVNKLLTYKRNPFKFKVMNGTDITTTGLSKHLKNHLKQSIALRSMDYHQTIIFTPVIKFSKSSLSDFHVLTTVFKYADISKYPVYQSIQCANILRKLKFNNHFFTFIEYIEYLAMLHSGFITATDDINFSHMNLETNVKLQPTTYNAKYFSLKYQPRSFIGRTASSGGLSSFNPHPKLVYNHKVTEYIKHMAYFLSPVIYIRKKYSKHTKNGYMIHFHNFDLMDSVKINYKK